MNINVNLKDKGKTIKKKTINNGCQPQTIIKTTIVACFISSVIQFDKYCHPLVLYGNYLICIFMKINENFKSEDKAIA